MSLANSARPTLPAALDMALVDLAEVVDRLGRVLLDLDVCDLDARALILMLLREQRQLLAQHEASAESVLARDLHDKRTEVPGVGVVEKRGGALYKRWDDRALAFALLEDVMTDTDTGEVVPEVRETVNLVVDALFAAASVGYWRTTVLKEQGLTPGDFCDVERGRVTVQITPVDAADSAA